MAIELSQFCGGQTIQTDTKFLKGRETNVTPFNHVIHTSFHNLLLLLLLYLLLISPRPSGLGYYGVTMVTRIVNHHTGDALLSYGDKFISSSSIRKLSQFEKLARASISLRLL